MNVYNLEKPKQQHVRMVERQNEKNAIALKMNPKHQKQKRHLAHVVEA